MRRDFHYNQPEHSLQPEWWLGEPVCRFNTCNNYSPDPQIQMWETAGKAGLITANLMWSVICNLNNYRYDLDFHFISGPDRPKRFPERLLRILSPGWVKRFHGFQASSMSPAGSYISGR